MGSQLHDHPDAERLLNSTRSDCDHIWEVGVSWILLVWFRGVEGKENRKNTGRRIFGQIFRLNPPTLPNVAIRQFTL